MVDIDFFSSPIGLGHVTRDIAIVNNFKNISTKFITGSSAAKILKNSNFNVEDLYRPPLFKVKDGKLKNSARWLWNYYQYYKECKIISKKIILQDKPSLVVSDEDFASLAIAQDAKIPTVLITDITKTNFVRGIGSFIERKMNQSMQKIIDKSDKVIIPEDGPDQGNITRVGTIVRKINSTREELRKKYSFTKKTIIVSAGGTATGLFLFEKMLDLAPKLNKDIDVVFVTGPNIQKKIDRIRNLGFIDNLHEAIFAADLVVSLAGKSTIDEARAYGTPGIFIPLKAHFEQEDNARDEGFVFEDLERLYELICNKLDQKRNPVESLGAQKASQIITELIESKSNP